MNEALLGVLLLGVGAMIATLIMVLIRQGHTNAHLASIDEVLHKMAGVPITPSKTVGNTGFKALLIMLLVGTSTLASSPADAATLAWKDLQTLPLSDAKYTRYLSIYHISDPKRQQEWKQVTDFWVNSLSRKKTLTLAYPVSSTLFRIDLRRYDIPTTIWERLAKVDPYFHADLEITKVKIDGEGKEVEEKPVPKSEKVEYETKMVPWEGGIWPHDGKNVYYEKGAFQYEKKVPKPVAKDKPTTITKPTLTPEKIIEGSPAPWLSKEARIGLTERTRSAVPIVRADWFLVETSQQDERDGTGYYDFLQVKNRDDFFELVGLNRKLAEKKEEEIRAIVPISLVAINNRQIIRLGTVSGAVWITLDVERRKRKVRNEARNAARNLNGDFVHDAEEIYASDSNGLLKVFAGNAQGVRQDSVPPQIAGAGNERTGNDNRIHPFSCIKCHKEGIRPIKDWGRRVYRANGPLMLVGPTFEKQERLQRLYLNDLETDLADDQVKYARALFRVSGLKPTEMANLFGKLHDEYLEKELGLVEIGAELGFSKAHVQASLMMAALTLQRGDIALGGKRVGGKYLDPNLAALLDDPQVKMRREYFEEVFAQMMGYMGGVVP